MRILQLTPGFPYPKDDGGRIGIANITREFSAQGNEVTLVSIVESLPKPEHKIEAESYANLEFLLHSTKNTKSKIIKSILYNHSIYLEKHDGLKLREDLSRILNDKEFDVIHADHTSMMPLATYAKKITGKPIGLRLHNIEWMIWQRYADNLPRYSPKKLYIQRQSNLLRDSEMKYISEADVVFTITNTDLEKVRFSCPNAKVICAGPGVNPLEWIPDGNSVNNPHEIILATTYIWVHNVDAVRWFIDYVLPKIRESVPDAIWTLLGKEPPSWLKEKAEEGVNAVGYVDSVIPYLNKASVYAAPLFVGAGIRIKILEAMAMELPVIATKVSAEGIGAGREDGLIVVSNEEEYAKEIVHLLKNPELARCLGKKAREYILGNFSWETNVGKMIKAYQKLTGLNL